MQSQQVGSTASELPLWRKKISRVLLTKGTVSVHSHKGNKLKIAVFSTQISGLPIAGTANSGVQRVLSQRKQMLAAENQVVCTEIGKGKGFGEGDQ